MKSSELEDWGLQHSAFIILTHGWKGLNNITMIDKACVRQQGGAAEARQGSPLSSQQHQVTGWHLWEIGQATSNTYKAQWEGKTDVKKTQIYPHAYEYTVYRVNVGMQLLFISHPWFWLLLMLPQWWRDLGQWRTSWTQRIHIFCVWTGSTREPCRRPPPAASALLQSTWSLRSQICKQSTHACNIQQDASWERPDHGFNSVDSPLCSGCCDTDDHDGSIGENLLQSFIVLAFLQIVSQFLKMH